MKIIKVSFGKELHIGSFPYFHRSVPISVIQKTIGQNALLVRCGNKIYDLSKDKELYDKI